MRLEKLGGEMTGKSKKKTGRILALVIIAIITINFKIILKSFFPLEYKESILEYSQLYNVDPNWVASVINTESNFNVDATSSKGAIGLMQIMPETGAWIGGLLKIEDFKENMIIDPKINIRMGTWYLNKLSNDFNGDFELVLAAYNGGPGNVTKWLGDDKYSKDGKSLIDIPFKETKNYVKKVKANYKVYKYLYNLKI